MFERINQENDRSENGKRTRTDEERRTERKDVTPEDILAALEEAGFKSRFRRGILMELQAPDTYREISNELDRVWETVRSLKSVAEDMKRLKEEVGRVKESYQQLGRRIGTLEQEERISVGEGEKK